MNKDTRFIVTTNNRYLILVEVHRLLGCCFVRFLRRKEKIPLFSWMHSQSNGIVLFKKLVTQSPESCSLMVFLSQKEDHIICEDWYTNLKVGGDKVLRKNVQRMPSSTNSVGKN